VLPPGGVKTRSSAPPQAAHRVAAGSLTPWRSSVRVPQLPHAYSYSGIFQSPFFRFHRTAPLPPDG